MFLFILSFYIYLLITIKLVMSGQDGIGSVYSNIQQMWEVQLHNQQPKNKLVNKVGSVVDWYNKANQYWSKSEPTYDGVLGGFGNLSAKDIKFSLSFILNLIKERPSFKRESVLDCGAGIGRISKDLLCQVFKTVDLVDQCQKLVQKAKQLLKQKKTMRNFYVNGLQKFDFSQRYDCIWVQWVFSQLNDDDAVAFLKKAKASVKEGGVIILKQNHCSVGFVVDKEDCSVTRCSALFKDIFVKAGLKIVKEQQQHDWPQDLFMIRMYALE